MKLSKRALSVMLAAAMTVTSVVVPAPAKAAETYSSVFQNYIKREGTKLKDGDKELKFVSLNYPQATSDTPWENANAMKTIRDMGGNVTRTYTIPVYNGENASTAYVTGVDKNDKLTFNEDALNALDSVLAQANKYGIRVIIPLVDHWHWIGGMDGYVWLAGESDGNKPTQSGFQDWAWKFYTSEKCMDYFKQMITHLLERKNTVTGVQYKNDKAILCWETGNEIGNRQQQGDTKVFNGQESDGVLTAWTNKVVEHIKSIDENHLVLDGRMSMSTKSLSAENKADILGAHYYEGNYPQRCENDTKAAHAAGKPFILGEFGAKTKAQDCIDVFEKGRINDTNGIMMWSLRAHKDGYGYYFHNEDGYWASYHWPGFESGNYYGEKEIIRSIYAYAQIANGKATTYEEAKEIKIPAPETDEAPLLYAPSGTPHDRSFKDDSVGDIKWRGVVGGAWYEIQRADGVVTESQTESAAWETIAGESDNVYDSGRNWEDKAHDCIAGYHDETAVDGQTYSYRLRACNESGVGLWSNIVTVNSAKHVVVDDLDLIAVSSDDANPTEIRNTYSSDHSANISYSSSSIVNKSDTEGYIEYSAKIPVDEISVTAVAETEEDAQPKIMVSKDGISFEPLTVSHVSGTKVYSAGNVLEKDKYYYSRIYIAGQSQCKLDSITLTYNNDGNSYKESGADIKTNVMIQDNTYGEGKEPYYTAKDSNLVINTVSGVKGLTTNNDGTGCIIYKTGDDINAYRVIVNSKDKKNAKVEYSYDGVTYKDAKTISSEANGDFTKTVYGDLTVAETVRVIRITLPEGSKEKVLVESVELSSGRKSIPLADTAPSNTLEDGEYYFGSDENLAKDYKITSVDNGISFSKKLGGVDFSSYDCLYAWIKPDNSNNLLALKLTDENGKTWTSEKVTLTGTTAFMKKFNIEKAEEVNWSRISKAEFIIVKGSGNVTNATGNVKLNASNVYSGNYGVALNYTFAGTESTVYVDSVYASASTKVDDFEGYSGSNTLLNQAYKRNTNGGAFDLSLDSANKSEGTYGLRVDYDYKGTEYAGATKTMDLLNLAGYDGFTMFINSDGSGNEIKVQMETEKSTYAYTGYMTGKGPMTLYMPFEKIIQPDWATGGSAPQPIDSSQNLKSVSIYTNQKGSVTKGTFYVDDLKGANFKNDLGTKTEVTMDAVATEITSFPATISGTAKYVDFVSVKIADKVFNVPVKDGKWSYDFTKGSGIYNGDEIAVKAGFYYPDGEAVKETGETKVKIQVEGNDAPIVESYDNDIWTWNFDKDGAEGWTFEGFTPWVEKGNLTAWSQTAYSAVFSYTVLNIPNGTYTLGNDIKVKSNMNNVQMALESGENEVQSSPIDTGDVLMENFFLGKEIVVTDHKVTIKYYVEAPDDQNGATFAVGNIKLYLAESADLITNGDFSETTGEWPKYPIGWKVTPNDTSGDVKVDAKWDEAGSSKFMVVKSGTAFQLSQTVKVAAADEGTYELSLLAQSNESTTVSDYKAVVKNVEGTVIGSLDISDGTCKLSDLTLTKGSYTVEISGTLGSGTIYLDDVSLKLVDWNPSVEPDDDTINYIKNGDFTQIEKQDGAPDLPVGFEVEPKDYSVKAEGGRMVAYADNAYTFAVSQTVSNLPYGIYTLSADMILNDATETSVNSIKLIAGTQEKEVKDLLNCKTDTKVSLENIRVASGMLEVKVAGDVGLKGCSFDNLTLTKTGDLNLVDNGDFSQLDNDWPNLPTGYASSYTGGDDCSPIKGDTVNHNLVAYAGKAYTFELKKTISNLREGKYVLKADIKLNDAAECKVNRITLSAGERSKDVEIGTLNSSDFTTVSLGDIILTGNELEIKVAADVAAKGFVFDNLVLMRVDDATQPTITKQPQSATYTKGDSASELSVEVSVTDGGKLSYQWYSNAQNQTEGASIIADATGSTYMPSTTDKGTKYYFCKVTNTQNDVSGNKKAEVCSDIARIVVNEKAGGAGDNPGTTIPSGTEVTPGEPEDKPQPSNPSSKKENPVEKATGKVTKPIGTKSFYLKTNGKGKLTYKSSDKKVVTVNSKGKVTVKGYGKAVITVNAQGNASYESGVKKITIIIVPKKATLKVAKSTETKSVKVTWKKDSKVSGYQIEYSTNKNFTNSKKVFVKSSGQTEKSITNLKSGKKYYIRVCEYKKSGKTTYYGSWSSAKSVEVR